MTTECRVFCLRVCVKDLKTALIICLLFITLLVFKPMGTDFYNRICAFYPWIHEGMLRCLKELNLTVQSNNGSFSASRIKSRSVAVVVSRSGRRQHFLISHMPADPPPLSSHPPAAPLPPPSIVSSLLYFTLCDHLDSFRVHREVWGHNLKGSVQCNL